MNLLFICSKNKWRSPTAEQVFKNNHGLNTRSAGTSKNARHTVNTNDINWSDLIFVMENKHKKHILERFREPLKNKTVIVLGIPDDYYYMDSELVEWLTEAVGVYL